MPAAPALLEAAASSASILVPVANAWTLRLCPELQSSNDAHLSCELESKPTCMLCCMLSSLGMENRLCRQNFVFHSPTQRLKLKHPTQQSCSPSHTSIVPRLLSGTINITHFCTRAESISTITGQWPFESVSKEPLNLRKPMFLED